MTAQHTLTDLEVSVVRRLVCDMSTETAELADQFLWRNVDDQSGTEPTWKTTELDREGRMIFSQGNRGVGVFFKHYEDYRKFELWCEFNPVTVYWSVNKGLLTTRNKYTYV